VLRIAVLGHAWAGLLDYLDPDGPMPFMPSSRRFFYWNMCDLGGFAGGMRAPSSATGPRSARRSACRTRSPASSARQSITRKPKPVAYTQAERRLRAQTYHALYGLDAQLACLAEGFPFVFGFTVFEGFLSAEVARTGVYAMPDLGREKVVGGHAMMAVGYSVPKQQVLVRNSWGEGWGQGGFAWLPMPMLDSDDTARL
jgi:hypothetical protein